MIQSKQPYQMYLEISKEFSSAGLVVNNDQTLEGMANTFGSRLAELYTNQDVIFSAYRLANAAGQALDDLALAYGIQRYRFSPVMDNSNTNFKFSLSSGITADQIAADPLQPLLFPGGVQITSGLWKFYTTSDVFMMPGSSVVYAPITASVRGNSTILPGQLTNHNLSNSQIGNLDPNAVFDVYASNDKQIVVTPQNESDTDLRSRIYTRINSMNNTNEDAITLALAVMGVDTTAFHKDMFGVGTLGVELGVSSAIISDYLLDAADRIVKSIAPYARVIRPDYVDCAICVQIALKNYDLQEATMTDLTQALTLYVNALPLGATLITDNLNQVISSNDNVSATKIALLKLDGRRVAVTNQMAGPTEKFILQESNVEFKL